MKTRFFYGALILLGLTNPDFSQDGKREDLQNVVQKLEKEIAEVRGLPFKNPVVAKIIPRPPEASKGVQGY